MPLADARLIARLRRGEPAAQAELWEAWKAPIWSLCRGVAEDAERARLLLQDVYGTLPTATRGWTLDAPVCCQVSQLLWQRTVRVLELPELSGIVPRLPTHTARPSPGAVAGRLAGVAPELRLVYLLDVFFRCPSAVLAELAGCSEQDIRNARAQVAWALVARSPA